MKTYLKSLKDIWTALVKLLYDILISLFRAQLMWLRVNKVRILILYCSVWMSHTLPCCLYLNRLDCRTARIPAMLICWICHWTDIFSKNCKCESNKEQDSILECWKTWSLINTLRLVGCYSHLWEKQWVYQHILIGRKLNF